MTRPRTSLAAALLILLASCGPQATPVSTASSTPAAAAGTPAPHASEIRFALIGEVTDANVWALFDAKGYSYNNYAVRSEYWPRLYRLSIPDRQFQPMAAGGMPSPVQHDGDFYTATVPLRTDLNWTDGSPFTAEDVAFTVNAALSFQLGFDWHDYYNPEWLDHAEALDAHTVKFYFMKAPNVGVWQYGALQGPIVQKSYWLPKIAAPRALLPSSDLTSQIEAFKARVADLQKQVDALHAVAATAPVSGEEARQNQMTLNRQQRDLNAATNDLAKAQSDFAAALNAARQSLYALEDKDEPTLGNWLPAGEENGMWVNKANPAHPFGEPHFDRASYKLFMNEASAVKSLQNGDVDSILTSGGISVGAARQFSDPGSSTLVVASPSQEMRFLVFNHLNPALADRALHQSLSCLLDNNALVSPTLLEHGGFSRSFVLRTEQGWYDVNNLRLCEGLNEEDVHLQKSVEILKSAGYAWALEPQSGSDAKGLKTPDGEAFPSVALLAPASDPLRVELANLIRQKTRRIGITLTIESVSAQEVNYAVFSSHQYDMALLGWQVSEYPGYLCDWFGDGNPFGYRSDRLQSACEALNSTSDLDQARRQVYEIQSILAQDLPFIPLYSGVTYDAYRNITYPFDSVLGGLSGIYGAPSLAIPASP